MCHIVGEKPKAPRGISPLGAQERSEYDNLILLCSHHHDTIDKDPKGYPVEILHSVKTKHELWVSESLSAKEPSPDQLVFADLIDTITTALRLDEWPHFIDHAVRELIHKDYLDARGVLNAKLLAAIWPTTKKPLTNAIRALLGVYSDFVSKFEENCEMRNGSYLGPDKSAFRFDNPRYFECAEKERVWAEEYFAHLCRFVVALNDYASAVRRNFNPLYFRAQGLFLVADSMGYRFGGKPTLFRPTAKDVTALFKKAAAKRREFNRLKAANAFPIRSLPSPS